MTFLSLFSGVGGLDRAFPNQALAHVEWNPYAQSVLRRHWPDVPVLGDVRTVNGADFRGVDLVVGGPPCQAASHAGLQLGEADERWMWPEFIRIVREAEPRAFLAENVPGLVTLNAGRSFGAILSALSALGFFIRWDHCTAAEVGRPHLRDRVWIVGTREPGPRGWCSVPIGQVQKWPRAGWAYEGRTGEDVPRWPKREVWPLVDSRVCPPAGMWPTPGALDANNRASATCARDGSKGGEGRGTLGVTLVDAMRLWPTPSSHDGKGSNTPEQRRGQLTAATEPGNEGRLNPAWVESLLLGWPLGWTEPEGPSLADAPAPPRDEEIAPRLTTHKPNRRDRLRCTGNGVCTETAALIYGALLATSPPTKP